MGALGGAAQTLAHGAALLGVDVGELEVEGDTAGAEGQGGAQERQQEDRPRHFFFLAFVNSLWFCVGVLQREGECIYNIQVTK